MSYNVTTHHGQVCELFAGHFGGNRPFIGVEVGTLRADLTKTLLWQFPGLTLYTIDPWEYEEGNLFEAGHPPEEIAESKAHALNCLKEFGSRVVIMPMKSDEAFKVIPGPVDFVWIDGDHMIESVKKDIRNGLKLVKPGGILGGHDYATVVEAINEVLAGHEVHQGGDLTWWVFIK